MSKRDDEKLISEAMKLLGSRRTPAKIKAARKNGKLGGRPVGSKDSKPRKRRRDSSQ